MEATFQRSLGCCKYGGFVIQHQVKKTKTDEKTDSYKLRKTKTDELEFRLLSVPGRYLCGRSDSCKDGVSYARR